MSTKERKGNPSDSCTHSPTIRNRRCILFPLIIRRRWRRRQRQSVPSRSLGTTTTIALLMCCNVNSPCLPLPSLRVKYIIKLSRQFPAKASNLVWCALVRPSCAVTGAPPFSYIILLHFRWTNVANRNASAGCSAVQFSAVQFCTTDDDAPLVKMLWRLFLSLHFFSARVVPSGHHQHQMINLIKVQETKRKGV